MKMLRLGLALLAVCVAPLRAQEPVELKGEVFIVTKRAESIRLGLVEVRLFTETEIKAHIAERDKLVGRERPDFEKHLAAWDEVINLRKQTVEMQKALIADMTKARRPTALAKGSLTDLETLLRESETDRAATLKSKEAWPHSSHYFKNLPETKVTTRTDADGKFSLPVPATGRFAIVASASRELPSGKEQYHWMVWVSTEGGKTRPLLLGNHNILSSDAKESVVRTKAE